MSIKTIDSHTHIQMIDSAQQDAVIARALDAGIGIINAGADEQSSRDAVLIAHKYKNVWATVGLHPHETGIQNSTELTRIFTELQELGKDEKVVGIGECGLEYTHFARHLKERTQNGASAITEGDDGYTPKNIEKEKELQKELFETHIQIAYELKKPLVIHCRDAFGDTIKILEANKEKLLPTSGILHFFTGTVNDARELLELGFSFTFGGLITFNRSFDEVIKYIPDSRILAETDAPWVTPFSRKKNGFLKNEYGAVINEPVYITEVVEWLAKIKEIEQKEMEKILLENTKKVFKINR
jgi:TatD DNase family protein